MEQLEKLINKLNTDNLCAVTIYDNDLEKNVCVDLFHTKIIEDFSDAESYFEDLYAKQHTNLTIQERRKNGNSIKNIGASFTAKFGNQKVENKSSEILKKKKKKPKEKALITQSDLIDLRVQEQQKKTLEKELDELKAKKTKLKKKLKKAVLEASKNSFWNGLIGNADTIINGISKIIPSKTPVGLGAFADENLTEVQSTFVNTIKLLDDDSIQLLATIHKKVKANHQDTFTQELVALLEKFNMISA